MSYLALALNLIRVAIQSETARAIGRYAIRQATAAVVREIRRQTVKRRVQHIS